MKKTKSILAFTLTLLILIISIVPVCAATYFEYDHFIFTRNDDLTIEIADYDNSSEDMVIPSDILGFKVVAIADVAFYENTAIKTAVLPDTLLRIGSSAFYGAKNLTSINIPKNCTQLESLAFQYCSSLKEVKFESDLTQINKQTFYGCSGLEEIRLPKTVDSIGSYAFAACTSLMKIYIPEATTSIDAKAFRNSPNVTIYGYRDSYAQTYADENGIPFIVIDAADKTELEEALYSAQAILSDDNSPYTTESLDNLNSTVLIGNSVLNDEYASQSDVDNAVENIQAAIQNLVPNLSEYIYGDAYLDGYVEIDDATGIQKYLAEILDFSSLQVVAADANCDGNISIDDVTAIQRYLAEYEVGFVGEKIPSEKFNTK